MWQTIISGFLISALGSVPIGVINLTIVQIVVNKGFKAAMQFIIIALFAEFFHVWLALLLFNYINRFPIISQYFDWAAVVFILIMATASLLKKKRELTFKKENVTLWKAFIINFLNPFSIPFWLFFTTYALNAHWIEKNFNEILYCSAATLGALVTLSFYAFGGKALMRWEYFKKLNIDRILGIVFLLLALWKLIKIFL